MTDRDRLIELVDKAKEEYAGDVTDHIIGSGYEEVVEEVDRLTELGFDNMTAREKAYFKVLAEHRQKTEQQNELSKIGVTDEVYNSKEFQDFAKQFNSKTPIADIFNIYNKMQPKKEIKPMGSMKNTADTDTGVKEFYSYGNIYSIRYENMKQQLDPRYQTPYITIEGGVKI